MLKSVFEEITLQDFEFFLSEITQLSLSSTYGDPDYELTTVYIQLIKMLDAGGLIRERGIEKIKKEQESLE